MTCRYLECFSKFCNLNRERGKRRFGKEHASLRWGYSRSRPKRGLQSMKRFTELALILSLFVISSWAQENRNEVTVQGSGFFQKQTTSGGVTNDPTNSGGVMAGYRFNLKKW